MHYNRIKPGYFLPCVFEESRRFVEARGNKRRTESDEADMDMQSTVAVKKTITHRLSSTIWRLCRTI